MATETDHLSTLALSCVDEVTAYTVKGAVRVGLAMCVVAETYCDSFFGVPMPREAYRRASAAYREALRP